MKNVKRCNNRDYLFIEVCFVAYQKWSRGITLKK